MISKGKVVSLAYTLKDDGGQVLDRAETTEPFSYLHGVGQIVNGLESALEGLKVGDKKVVTVEPKDGYGELNPNLKVSVPKTEFPADAKIQKGMQFVGRSEDGHEVVYTVENVQTDTIQLNGNHPLAGQTLNFDVEVIAVRDATEEEQSHGHAHGPEGHSH